MKRFSSRSANANLVRLPVLCAGYDPAMPTYTVYSGDTPVATVVAAGLDSPCESVQQVGDNPDFALIEYYLVPENPMWPTPMQCVRALGLLGGSLREVDNKESR